MSSLLGKVNASADIRQRAAQFYKPSILSVKSRLYLWDASEGGIVLWMANEAGCSPGAVKGKTTDVRTTL
jgi:hypothetical protein